MLNPHRPLAPTRFPFFYGWTILVVACIGVLMSIPGQTMGVSVFSDPLLEATGLTRVGLANSYLAGTLASGFLLPHGGKLLDRFGARLTAMGASLALGVALVALSRIDRLAQAVSSSEWVMLAVLAAAFSLLRFSGQGMLTLASRNMVPKWFERRRGLASGLFNVFTSLGFSYAPVALAAIIAAAGGWREAWLVLAAACGVGMTVCAWIFYRDNPEECGLRMDGAPAQASPGEEAVLQKEPRRFDRAAALRTGAFWAVTLGISIHSALVTGVTFHIVDLGAEAGLTQSEAVGLFPPIALISIVTSLSTGAAVDRLPLRPILFLLLLGEGMGYSSLSRLDETAFRYASIAGLGIANGCFGTLSTVACAKLFGRTHLGAISSAQMSSLVLSSALGPSLLALSRDRLASYGPGLILGAATTIAVLVVTLLSRDPGRERGVW